MRRVLKIIFAVRISLSGDIVYNQDGSLYFCVCRCKTDNTVSYSDNSFQPVVLKDDSLKKGLIVSAFC